MLPEPDDDEVTVESLQSDILRILAKRGVINRADGIIQGEAALEAMGPTLVMCAIEAKISEDFLVDRLRVLYRHVEAQRRGGSHAPSIIIPGRG